MGRKMGLLGLAVVVLLYFLAGVLIAWFINIIDARLPDNLPLREYFLAGITSLLGFFYRFLVFRLAGKSIKKLLLG